MGPEALSGPSILIENGLILDSLKGEVLGERSVLVSNGRVQEITEEPIGSHAAVRIDARGGVVMPGLCDAHVHICAPTNRFSDIPHLSSQYVGACAVPILEGMLMRGFTTVRDAGGADFGIVRAVREGKIKGPRILHSGRALSQTGGHGDMRGPGDNGLDEFCHCCSGLGRICDGVAEVRRAARDEIRKGATQIKLMASGGAASPADPIHFTQFSQEEIRAAVEEAEAAGTYVMAHAYTAKAVNRALLCGVRSIEHGTLIDADSIQIFRDRGAFLVPTLCVVKLVRERGLELGFSQEHFEKLAGLAEKGEAMLTEASRRGVKIVFGSDLSGDLHPFQSTEFLIRTEIQKPGEVIRSATSIAAELFGMDGEIGVVAPGARADILIVDGNPLEDLSLLQDQGAHLKLIMKDGVIYKRDLV